MLTSEEKEALEKSIQGSENTPSPNLTIENIRVFGMEVSPGAYVTLLTKHRGAIDGNLISATSRWVYIVHDRTQITLAIRISYVLELQVYSKRIKKFLMD